ncbi:MAG: trigger factor [Rickettsia sp.]|nr:trigger factor [Rickettsia sp.]
MEFTKIKNQDLQVSYKITVPSSQINENIKLKFQELGNSIRLNGFRKGKIPDHILKNKYGDAVRQEVVQQSFEKALKNITKSENLELLSSPNITQIKSQEGLDLEFEMDLVLKPSFSFPKFSELKIPNPVFKISIEDIRREILLSLAKIEDGVYEDSEIASSKGDLIIVDIKSYEGEKLSEKPFITNQKIEIGANIFLPELEDELVNVKKDEEKTVSIQTLNLDKNGISEIKFHIKALQILKAKKNFKIDNKVSIKLGFDKIEDLKISVQQSLEKYCEDLKANFLKIKLFDELEKILTFQVPKTILNKEIDQVKQKYLNFKTNQIKESDLLKNNLAYLNKLEFIKISNKSDDIREKYFEQIALRRVRIGIFIEEFVLKNKIEVSKEEIGNMIYNQASLFPGKEKEIFKIYQQNAQLLDSLVRPELERKAVKKILEQVNLEDKNFSRESLEKSIKNLHSL